MNSLLFSLNAVLPVFLLIVLGIILKKMSILDDEFITKSTRLVFKVTLPVLVFNTVSHADFKQIYNGTEVFSVVFMVTVGFLLIFFISRFFIKDGPSRSSFIQGAFRSNAAIVGLAVIANVFGDTGLAKAAIPMVFIFPMFNVYSVLALTIPLNEKGKTSPFLVLKIIITNPLIISVLIALPFTLFAIPIAPVADTFFSYLSRMTLPLALLSIGGSLNFHSFKKELKLALSSTFIKLVIYPLVTAFVLIALGITGESFGVIFIMMGCPTAISSYVMADVMGANKELASGIIVLTTLASTLTLGIGLFVIKALGLI